jgi:Cu(I)/Ag(I) efflux system membrane fusion protein
MFATVWLETPVRDLEPFRSLFAGQAGESEAGDLIAPQKVCPVTGSKLGSMGAPVRARAGDKTVLLCCASCQPKLKERSEYYLNRLSTVTSDGVLAVPELAVVETGSQTLVYVEREPGVFEGVAVTLGPHAQGYYAVGDGLLAGDRVAAAGAFLVDAETRLNPAASATYFGAGERP